MAHPVPGVRHTPARRRRAARSRAREAAIRRRLALLTLAAALLTGCATTYTQGAAAYRQGDYARAAERFQAVLAEDPDRVDALVGLGLTRYASGAWAAAVDPLARAVGLAPRDAVARLYLGLAHLRADDDARAVEHLTVFRDLTSGTRVGAQADRALRLLRDTALPPDLRAFVASSLEEASATQRELAAVREALRIEEFRRLTDERLIYVPTRCRC